MCKRFMRFPLILLAGVSVGARGQVNQDRPHTTYTLLSYNQGDDGVGTGSRTQMLLQRTLIDASDGGPKPLIEGWTSASFYSRIYGDKQIYFVLRPSTVKSKAQVCRVEILGLPASFMFPDVASVGAGIEWCTAPHGVAPAVSNPDRGAWPPRGKTGSMTTMRSADGTSLNVLHLTGLKTLDRPVPPANVADVLTTGLFPGSRESAKRLDRQLYVLRLKGGEWAMALKFHRPFGGDLSACFLTTTKKNRTIPRENWITAEIEDWCRKNSDSYLASLPADQIPAPIVFARSGPAKTDQDD